MYYQVDQVFRPKGRIFSFQFCKVKDIKVTNNELIYRIECDNGDEYEWHLWDVDRFLAPIDGNFDILKVLYSKGKRVV